MTVPDNVVLDVPWILSSVLKDFDIFNEIKLPSEAVTRWNSIQGQPLDHLQVQRCLEGWIPIFNFWSFHVQWYYLTTNKGTDKLQ